MQQVYTDLDVDVEERETHGTEDPLLVSHPHQHPRPSSSPLERLFQNQE